MADHHPAPVADRREALKARHRRAIVAAAADLMREIGGTDFTVDQLAARADVSRRTVFNHFTTVDDITVEVFHEMLGAILDNVDANFSTSAAQHPGEHTMFDELAGALRATDLVATITELTRIFGPDEGRLSARQAVLFERAISDLGSRMAAITLRHHPMADPLEVDLMCGSLVGGALVVFRHWGQRTGGVDSAESRRTWDELLERMITINRAGFGTLTPATDAS
jgi:AcrR family transcriptional regulator